MHFMLPVCGCPQRVDACGQGVQKSSFCVWMSYMDGPNLDDFLTSVYHTWQSLALIIRQQDPCCPQVPHYEAWKSVVPC